MNGVLSPLLINPHLSLNLGTIIRNIKTFLPLTSIFPQHFSELNTLPKKLIILSLDSGKKTKISSEIKSKILWKVPKSKYFMISFLKKTKNYKEIKESHSQVIQTANPNNQKSFFHPNIVKKWANWWMIW